MQIHALFTCVCIIVHKCRRQHSTEQYWLFSPNPQTIIVVQILSIGGREHAYKQVHAGQIGESYERYERHKPTTQTRRKLLWQLRISIASRRSRRQNDYLDLVFRLVLTNDSPVASKFDVCSGHRVQSSRRTTPVAAKRLCLLVDDRRAAEHGAQEADDSGAESVAEVAVDERVDAAVAGAEPLR